MVVAGALSRQDFCDIPSFPRKFEVGSVSRHDWNGIFFISLKSMKSSLFCRLWIQGKFQPRGQAGMEQSILPLANRSGPLRSSVIHQLAARGRAGTTKQLAGRFLPWNPGQRASLGGGKRPPDVFWSVRLGKRWLLRIFSFRGLGSARESELRPHGAILYWFNSAKKLLSSQCWVLKWEPCRGRASDIFVWLEAGTLHFRAFPWVLCCIFAQKLEPGHFGERSRFLRGLKLGSELGPILRIRARFWSCANGSERGERGGDGTPGRGGDALGVSRSAATTGAEDAGAERPCRCSGTSWCLSRIQS